MMRWSDAASSEIAIQKQNMLRDDCISPFKLFPVDILLSKSLQEQASNTDKNIRLANKLYWQSGIECGRQQRAIGLFSEA